MSSSVKMKLLRHLLLFNPKGIAHSFHLGQVRHRFQRILHGLLSGWVGGNHNLGAVCLRVSVAL